MGAREAVPAVQVGRAAQKAVRAVQAGRAAQKVEHIGGSRRSAPNGTAPPTIECSSRKTAGRCLWEGRGPSLDEAVPSR